MIAISKATSLKLLLLAMVIIFALDISGLVALYAYKRELDISTCEIKNTHYILGIETESSIESTIFSEYLDTNRPEGRRKWKKTAEQKGFLRKSRVNCEYSSLSAQLSILQKYWLTNKLSDNMKTNHIKNLLMYWSGAITTDSTDKAWLYLEQVLATDNIQP